MISLEEKDSNFWNIVQNAAKEKGCMFFMDVPSGKEIEMDAINAFDTFGWLIPLNLVDSFRADIDAGIHDSGKWDQFFANETFEIIGDRVEIHFEILGD